VNIDHLTTAAVLSVISARYRDKAPPDKDALVSWLRDEGAVITAAFIEAMPENVYKQAYQSLRRLRSVMRRGA